jgi:hypothetical protein
MRGRENLLDPHAFHAVSKWLNIDLVTITQEIGGRGLVREGVHDLLSGPVGGGVLGHVNVDDPTAVGARTTRTNRTRRRAVGMVKKSIETKSGTWLARNVRQV